MSIGATGTTLCDGPESAIHKPGIQHRGRLSIASNKRDERVNLGCGSHLLDVSRHQEILCFNASVPGELTPCDARSTGLQSHTSPRSLCLRSGIIECCCGLAMGRLCLISTHVQIILPGAAAEAPTKCSKCSRQSALRCSGLRANIPTLLRRCSGSTSLEQCRRSRRTPADAETGQRLSNSAGRRLEMAPQFLGEAICEYSRSLVWVSGAHSTTERSLAQLFEHSTAASAALPEVCFRALLHPQARSNLVQG